MLEKPIGHDLASARELAGVVRAVFAEPQVFRIDHYLGKEAVQNILAFRFANLMVERAWCGEAVDHVQITVAESGGIEERGRYYEEAGALRDMVQNHLLQVLAFVAMEPPASLAPEDVRDRKTELLEAVRTFSADELVRGRYTAGVVEGQEVPAAASSVETFVALRAWVDNARWNGVPFFLRTGKRLPRRTSEVAIVLRESERQLFDGAGIAGSAGAPSDAAHPARRGHLAGLSCEGARAGDGARRRPDGLLLRRLVQDAADGGLRATPA